MDSCKFTFDFEKIDRKTATEAIDESQMELN
jgi:hypothetical protein